MRSSLLRAIRKDRLDQCTALFRPVVATTGAPFVVVVARRAACREDKADFGRGAPVPGTPGDRAEARAPFPQPSPVRRTPIPPIPSPTPPRESEK